MVRFPRRDSRTTCYRARSRSASTPSRGYRNWAPAGGVAPPPRLVKYFRKRPAIGPDRAPLLVELVQDDHVLGRLDNPARPEVMEDDAGEALRIAPGHRIVGQRGWHHRHTEGRLVRHE